MPLAHGLQRLKKVLACNSIMAHRHIILSSHFFHQKPLVLKGLNPLITFVLQHSKDVRLPVQLQRAMAAEAEAAREARAKVSFFFCPPIWYILVVYTMATFSILWEAPLKNSTNTLMCHF